MLAIIGRRFWAGSCVQWRTNIYKKTPHHLVPTCMYSNKLDTEHLAVKMSGLVHIFASYRKTKKKIHHCPLCLLSWTNAVRCPFWKYPLFSARRCMRRTVRQSAQPVAPTPHLATGHQVSHRFRQLGLQWRDAYLCLNQWTCLLHCEFRAKVEPIHAWVTRAQKILTLRLCHSNCETKGLQWNTHKYTKERASSKSSWNNRQ